MSIKQDNYIICDICDGKERLDDIGPGRQAMIIYTDSFQEWGENHICKACCIILHKANMLGIVQLEGLNKR